MASLLRHIRENVFIIFIIFFALLWRLPLLTGSFWLDEAAQALESIRPLEQQLQIRDDFQPPLLHLLVHFELIFSSSEWWLRLGGALIPGLITIWLTYQIGKKSANERVGLFASVLLATSSFHLFFSQELRPYSLPALFAASSWLVLLNLIKSENKIKRYFFYFFLLSALGLYTSYLYPFLFISQVLFIFLLYPKLRKGIFVSTASACFAFLPWFPSFLDQLRAGQTLRQDLPGWQEVVSFNQVKSILLIFGKFIFGVLDIQVNFIFLVITGGIFAAVIFLFNALFKQKNTDSRPFTLFLFWLLVPIFFAWLVSFFVPVLQPKRVLYCLPAFYLAISWLADKWITNGKSSLLKKISLTLVSSLVLLNIFSSLNYFFVPKYQREDWRSLHTIILDKYAGKGNVAAFAFPAPFAPWQWYDDGSYPTFSTQELTTEAQSEIPNSKELTQYRFVLVFDYLRDLTDPKDKLLNQLKAYGYNEVDKINPTTPVGFVRVYAKSENVIGAAK